MSIFWRNYFGSYFHHKENLNSRVLQANYGEGCDVQWLLSYSEVLERPTVGSERCLQVQFWKKHSWFLYKTVSGVQEDEEALQTVLAADILNQDSDYKFFLQIKMETTAMNFYGIRGLEHHHGLLNVTPEWILCCMPSPTRCSGAAQNLTNFYSSCSIASFGSI